LTINGFIEFIHYNSIPLNIILATLLEEILDGVPAVQVNPAVTEHKVYPPVLKFNVAFDDVFDELNPTHCPDVVIPVGGVLTVTGKGIVITDAFVV
jgi:hypothetical protein